MYFPGKLWLHHCKCNLMDFFLSQRILSSIGFVFSFPLFIYLFKTWSYSVAILITFPVLWLNSLEKNKLGKGEFSSSNSSRKDTASHGKEVMEAATGDQPGSQEAEVKICLRWEQALKPQWYQSSSRTSPIKWSTGLLLQTKCSNTRASRDITNVNHNISPGWPGAHYLVQGGFKVIPLPQPFKSWVYRLKSPILCVLSLSNILLFNVIHMYSFLVLLSFVNCL